MRCPGPSDSSASSISISRFTVIAVGRSGSSPVLRTGTSSIEFWLICARRNKAALPYRTWCHTPEHPMSHCRFSQEPNPQPQISKDATEKRVVRRVAWYRLEMERHALCDHSHRQIFSEADRLALIFLAAVTRIDEAIFSR